MKREQLEKLIFGDGAIRRFTQDSPFLPDVWIRFGEEPLKRHDLLLNPYRDVTPGHLALALRDRLAAERKKKWWKDEHPGDPASVRDAQIAYNQATVAAKLTFDELIRVVLPMTSWWEKSVIKDREQDLKRMLADEGGVVRDLKRMKSVSDDGGGLKYAPGMLWAVKVVGTICLERAKQKDDGGGNGAGGDEACVSAFAGMMKALKADKDCQNLVWSVARNRPASPTVWRSTLAVKADAARGLFNISCKRLAWAVLDSGIDATHPAFAVRKDNGALPPRWDYKKAKRDWTEKTRVVATYDFAGIRKYLSLVDEDDEEVGAAAEGQPPPAAGPASLQLDDRRRMALRKAILGGHSTIDWDALEPALRIPHDKNYRAPRHEHGTHVAGILAGNWTKEESKGRINEKEDLVGVCPDLQLYDMRVLDDVTGEGDEFSVMAALQFIRHLNSHRDYTSIHGVNMSLSIHHDVANYACGCTPVCEECDRVVNAGTVIVAAAGNQGYMHYLTSEVSEGSGGDYRTVEGYRSISLTDPGNASSVITVGATHALRPHSYGVSYFSSRGPTGDGRIKPDIVAPGEKITSVVPGETARVKDGTSMAAPHVSGAAALLMARHKELIGNPQRVKQVLCETATDLGRERYFQGHGMVDILRALQAV